MATKKKKWTLKKTGHWFHDMPLAKKKEYLAKHPNSIYAKQLAKTPKKFRPSVQTKRIAEAEAKLKVLLRQYEDACNKFDAYEEDKNYRKANLWRNKADKISDQMDEIRKNALKPPKKN